MPILIHLALPRPGRSLGKIAFNYTFKAVAWYAVDEKHEEQIKKDLEIN